MKIQSKLTVQQIIRLLSRVKNKHQAIVHIEVDQGLLLLQLKTTLKVTHI